MKKQLFFKIIAFLFLSFTSWFSVAKDPLIVAHYGEIDPQQVRHVFSAGKVSDVMLISIAPEKLIGLSSALSSKIQPYFDPNIVKLPETGRLAGRGSTAPIEKIANLNPDLILDLGSTTPSYIATAERVYQQTNVPYVLIDGRFSQSAEQIRSIGKLLNNQDRAEKLAIFAERILSITENIGRQDNSLSVYVARGVDGLETGLEHSIHTEVIEWVGAKNAAAVIGQNKTVRISMEQLLQWQPDLIITQDPNLYKAIQTSELWQNLTAVKNQKIYLVPNEPFGWIDSPPSINRLLGAIWLGHLLNPHKLDQSTYSALITEYFELFYDHKLTEQEGLAFGVK
ncbi:iron ABC transporter substrate-binding protein [Mannheimia massilioguelmaensis]|uniref:iron ABC transporter substrate-binding protein n=1 Tax=Mannheimia massilioguelmaensis TaxID=1604354 RepID=UPI0005CAF284|nr:iron ABC transporter substrate-binding protein [Mannheimia massilioguelmaensis]